MVERPIKKSERAQRSDDDEQRSEHRERNRRGKGKGRKGGRDRDERDRKPAVPPALMRGPKPQPAKSVEEEPPAEATAEGEAPEGEAQATNIESISPEGATEEPTSDESDKGA